MDYTLYLLFVLIIGPLEFDVILIIRVTWAIVTISKTCPIFILQVGVQFVILNKCHKQHELLSFTLAHSINKLTY